MSDPIRALVMAAYEQGWRAACDDFMQQQRDPEHPIGNRKLRQVDYLLTELDPHDLFGLRGARQDGQGGV